MITGWNRFNLYLLPALVLALACGCHTTEEDRVEQTTSLRIHPEVNKTSLDFSQTVPVYRKTPVMVTVDKQPLLTEGDVAGAEIVDTPGGFSVQIKFNRHGTWVLESYTTTNPGRHLAIVCEFGQKGFKDTRWLAAPLIEKRIGKGILTFTPDATRAEAEQIVFGLNNVARKNKEDTRW